jgi:hypothetical protein
LWKDEKVEAEVQYNCLTQKYEKLKEEYHQLLTASLRFKEEQIEKVNKNNELETEYDTFNNILFSLHIFISFFYLRRLKSKLKEELEKASQDYVEVNLNNSAAVGPLN